MSEVDTEAAAPRLRADALRNRDALVASATQVFTERGTDASLEEIARLAGVGIGTLYRHFPTRDALVEAAYRQGVEDMCRAAEQLLAEHPADVALELWMRSFVGYVAAKRGLSHSLKAAGDLHSELFAAVHARIRGTMGSMLEAAAATGRIRGDVEPSDLIRALGGICMVTADNGPQEGALRLVSLVYDGLRYGARDSH